MKICTFNYFLLKAFKDIKRNLSLSFGFVFGMSATCFMSGLFALFMVILSRTFEHIFAKDKTYGYIIRFFNSTQFIVLILLIPISLILISHVIRMTVFCKKSEITTMKFLGADDSFIRWPFIIQGIILGIIGSTIGGMLLYIPYIFISDFLVMLDFPLTLPSPNDLLNSMIIPLIIAGPFIGAVGNLRALKKIF